MTTDIALLHGGGQGGWVWEDLIAALGGRLPAHVVALDVPGCGSKRGLADDALDNIAIAAALIAEIERAGLTDVALIGHSQAGHVMPFMAAARPDLFRRLIHVACSIPLPGQTLLDMMGGGRHGDDAATVGYPFDPATVDPRDRARLMFCNDMDDAQAATFLARLGPDRWPAATYAFTAWPTTPAPVPASYIVCRRDAVLPEAWQHRFAARLGAGRTVTIDTGHQPMINRPTALADILLGEIAACA